jgi:N-acetylmuramoyl-L-alanine amidase
VTLQADSRLVTNLHSSPNFEARRGGATPHLLILHYTGVPTCAKAIDWLSRPESKVSCHYVVDEGGRITQMVSEAHRAWHAGLSSWAGETDINTASIGIEIQNPGHDGGYPDFPDRQMDAVSALCLDIITRYGMQPRHVLAHSDIAPVRKKDPGEKFNWARLASDGIGHWVRPAPCDEGSELGHDLAIGDLQELLRAYGYGIETTGSYDTLTAFVVTAFQRHFRPARVDGRIDRSTVDTLQRLMASLAAGPVG